MTLKGSGTLSHSKQAEPFEDVYAETAEIWKVDFLYNYKKRIQLCVKHFSTLQYRYINFARGEVKKVKNTIV